MNNKNISTRSGILLIAIIAAVVAVLVLKYAENNQTAQVPDNTIPKNQEPQDAQNVTATISEPIEQWKTCHNTKGAYDIKYPSDWVIGLRGPYGYEQLKSCTSSKLLFTTYLDPAKIGDSGLGIDVQDTYKGTGFVFEGSKSLAEYFEKRPGMAQNFPIIKETVVDNERAVFVEDFPNPRVFVYHHDKVFDITGGNISEKSFTDFLSTFKFLK